MSQEDRMRRCITMAMGCLDPLSDDLDERLAWYRLFDALDGKEPRNCLPYATPFTRPERCP